MESPPSRSLADRIHLALGFPPLFWLSVVGCSLLAMGLLYARLAATRQTGHASLVWDTFLAWLPIFPAIWIHRICRRPGRIGIGVVVLGLFWLLFFPNSPYLLTQLIHLHQDHGPSTGPVPDWLAPLLPTVTQRKPPEWFDLLLLTTVAAVGLLLTFASLQLVGRAIARRAGRPMAVALSFWMVVLASFGVALGRFARLNSWEVFSQPLATAGEIARWIYVPRIGVSTLILATLITLVYVAAVQAGKSEPD